MESTVGWVFLISFAASRLLSLVYGLDTKYTTFEMLQEHPGLRKCAADVSEQNDYVGGRVSEKTGECQAFSHSWGLNPTTERGFACAMKVSVEENFEPPATSPLEWIIPGVLNNGARLDLSITNPNTGDGKVSSSSENLRLQDALRGDNGQYHFVYIVFEKSRMEIREEYDRKVIGAADGKDVPPTAFKSKNMNTLSVLVQDESVTVLIDDEELQRYEFKRHMDAWKINVHRSGQKIGPLRLHRAQFTAK